MAAIMTERTDITALEQRIFYHFRNRGLLEEALRHRSFVNEQTDSKLRDNERMEFLGDAVLNLIVSTILIRGYSDFTEGQLSRIRAGFINENQLSALAATMNLGDFIQMGKGEILSNGRNKKSILANTLEALIAAVYLDGGFERAFEFIRRHFSDPLEKVPDLSNLSDHKTRLQEWAQAEGHEIPEYILISSSGPDHDKTFSVQVKLFGRVALGAGKSKKAAEQDAARNALEIFAKPV